MRHNTRWWLGLLLLAAACGRLDIDVVTPTVPVATGVASATQPPTTTTAPALAATAAPSATPQIAPDGEEAPATAATTEAVVTQAATVAPSAVPATASASITAPPTVEPVTLPSTTAEAGPVVMHFVVGPANLVAGQEANLQWSADSPVSGTVDISLMVDDGARPTLTLWHGLPASGSLVVPLNMDPRGRYLFTLSPSFPADQPYYEIPLRFPCPDAFFFDMPANWQDLRPLSRAHCPSAAAAFPTALEQRFEGGEMLWLQSDGRVLVLYNDFTWEAYDDLWTVAEDEQDPGLVVPEGRFQPQRGLGKVWRDNPDVRQRLGWAVESEVGFTGAEQFDYVSPGTDTPQYRFVRLADGRVLALTTYAGHGAGAANRIWQVITGP